MGSKDIQAKCRIPKLVYSNASEAYCNMMHRRDPEACQRQLLRLLSLFSDIEEFEDSRGCFHGAHRVIEGMEGAAGHV